ncbi:hypothetical protein LTR84_007195 [Exophiala bonariae]|uniref:Uncharacterized protein n=1 Tax=Exophiala bonariae TaxID=1690606 RepID=A0AAV9MZ27_9EURO|nr:hypothetical protein LTR84_007195 [Exophiala bonariae]
MVKFRGIEVSLISQVDICRLPEYLCPPDVSSQSPNEDNPLPPNSPQYPVASCHVPIYPGSQIWLEYSIEGPHPPGAAYFFKLFVNGKEVTSWDCTAKHGFHGKMMHTLVNEGLDAMSGHAAVRRQALKFGDDLPRSELGQTVMLDDCLQVNVHRIEHRQRIRDLEEAIGSVTVESVRPDGIRLSNGGILNGSPRPRRYKYQLLDPKDAPYAAFRFFCRSVEDLDDRNVVPLQPCLSSSVRESSVSSLDIESPGRPTITLVDHIDGTTSSVSDAQDSLVLSSPPGMNKIISQSPLKLSLVSERAAMSDSDDSLSVKTKDSIEELASNVSRSPRSPKKSPRRVNLQTNEIPPSPTKSPLARKGLRRKLTLTIDGADFDLDRKKRPLSPFTGGGLLRKVSFPQTAPATVTEFGPSVEEEVKAGLKTRDVEEGRSNRAKCWSTTSERGGKSLMSFLGRRMASGKGV